MNKHIARALIIFVPLLALLGILWVAAEPSGALYPYLFASVANDKKKSALADNIFHTANTHITTAVEHYNSLSFSSNTEPTLPDYSGPKQNSIRDYIERINIGAEVEDQPITFEVEVKLIALWEKTYEWAGSVNYYIVFRSIEITQPEHCDSDQVHRCWKIVVQYWPSTLPPVQLTGTEETLSRDLAVLVLRGSLRLRDDEWRRGDEPQLGALPHLTAASIPITMESLEAIASGFDILIQGMDHPDCTIESSSADCLDYVHNLFLSSAETTVRRRPRYRPMAAYGIAHIELQLAMQAARNMKSSFLVMTHLENARRLTLRAFESPFLQERVKRHELTSLLPLKTDIVDLVGMPPSRYVAKMIQMFACALYEGRLQNWERCIALLNKIEPIPEPLQPYVSATLLDAELSSTTIESPESPVGASRNYQQPAAKLKEAFRRLSLQLNAPPTGAETWETGNGEAVFSGLVLLPKLCHRRDVIDDNSFARLSESIVERVLPGTYQIQHEIIIRAAACREGQTYPSDWDVAKAKESLAAMENEIERARVGVPLFLYYVRANDLDAALGVAKYSLRLTGSRAILAKTTELGTLSEREDYYGRYEEMLSNIRPNIFVRPWRKCGNAWEKADEQGRNTRQDPTT